MKASKELMMPQEVKFIPPTVLMPSSRLLSVTVQSGEADISALKLPESGALPNSAVVGEPNQNHV